MERSMGKVKHGLSHHPIYRLWCIIKHRCNSPENESYKWYGAKGICLCESWSNDFIEFYSWCLDNGWNRGLHLDRIDPNKNYDPSNCRFVTSSVNAIHRQREKPVNHRGSKNPNAKLDEQDVFDLRKALSNSQSIKELCKKYNISSTQILRIKYGLRWQENPQL